MPSLRQRNTSSQLTPLNRSRRDNVPGLDASSAGTRAISTDPGFGDEPEKGSFGFVSDTTITARGCAPVPE